MAANRCQRMCHCGLSLPIALEPVGEITSHLSHKVILGLDLSKVSQTLTLGWPLCDIELLLGGWASAGRQLSFELNTLGEKVG